MEIEVEVWKDIKGFEGFYQVSNLGRVRSLDHERKNKNGSYIQKSKILKAGINKNNGYLMVSLSKNGKSSTQYIHKLVAKTFISNPKNFPQVNHKNECKINNVWTNLEWCSSKYNTNYGNRNKKISTKLSKKINQFTLDDKLIKTWNSSVEIEKKIGLNQSNICLCCKGKRKTVGGYKWKYVQ